MNSSRTSKRAFFDDDDLRIRFDFTVPKPKHQKDLATSPLLCNTLVCSKWISNISNQGTFALHNRTLAFYKDTLTKSPDAVLDISFSTMRPLPFNVIYSGCGFRLTKNGNSYDFFCQDKLAIEVWVNLLKKYCILTTFHEDYKPIKPIGKGSFAKVYLAQSLTSKQYYAVKAFHKETMMASPSKDTTKPALINEINLMRCVEHENIIKLYEVYETGNSIYLVMQYIPDKSLKETFKKYSFRADNSEAKIKAMIYSLLDALAYLSSRGIMHRDLKPANILVDKDERLVIADFGLGTLVSAQKYIFRKCGTPGYIAPEVFKYNPKSPETFYDSKCDVFSIGCIFFQMIFGNELFDSENNSEVLYTNRKFSMEYDAIRMAQNEYDNPRSKYNKDALSLLLQLVNVDPTQRLSADDALKHSYFAKFSRKSRALRSKQSTQDIGSQSTQSESLSPGILKNLEDQMILSPKEESVTESLKSNGKIFFSGKDSLYLEIAKMDSSEKENTPGVSSVSFFMSERGDNKSSGNNISLNLNLINSGTPSNSSCEIQIRTPKKPQTPFNKQSFLKTAIKNNLKNNELEREEQKECELRLTASEPGFDGPFSPISDDIQADDIGEEDTQVQANFDKILCWTKQTHPSRMMLESRLNTYRGMVQKIK